MSFWSLSSTKILNVKPFQNTKIQLSFVHSATDERKTITEYNMCNIFKVTWELPH